MGNPNATDEEVETAARAAEIHDLIMSLPQGYETLAGERGGRFSGGQRQRIAIARAILRNPAILILDEATSALDPATEAAINATLSRIARNRTVISVTHRLNSVLDADRIFVMDRGQLVEDGAHEELLGLKGTYSALWRKQSGFTLNDAGDQAKVDAERLSLIPILERLDREMLVELAGLFSSEQYPADRLVIHEGDPGDKFYIIAHGQVSVTRRDSSGKDRQVVVLQDGDYYGEAALLRNAPRNATVRTLAQSLFLTLPRAQFLNLMAKAPRVRKSSEDVLTICDANPGFRPPSIEFAPVSTNGPAFSKD